jgi:hypothetical protein
MMRDVTLCLAALCREGEGENEENRVVVAADRMVTYPGFIEFEHTSSKIAEASGFTLAMVAGNALVGNRMVAETTTALSGTSPRVAEIARQLSQQYEVVRAEQVEHQILRPRGLDYTAFYDRHATLNGQITMMLDQQIAQFNPEVELLIAGVDDSGAHLFTVHNPGGPEVQHDMIGFAAVGSGWIHAMQSMIGFRHSAAADFNETVFRVYASKRRSEVAPGVGIDTDMCTLSPAGVHWLTGEEKRKLEGFYEDFQKATTKHLREKLAEFKLGEPSGSDDEEQN